MLSPFHPMQLAWGLLVWAAWFAIIYGGMSVGCNLGAPDPERGPTTLINLALLIFTIAVGLWLLYSSWGCWKAMKQIKSAPPVSRSQGAVQYSNPKRFIASLGFGVNLLAGLSTLLVGLPVLLLAPCLR